MWWFLGPQEALWCGGVGGFGGHEHECPLWKQECEPQIKSLQHIPYSPSRWSAELEPQSSRLSFMSVRSCVETSNLGNIGGVPLAEVPFLLLQRTAEGPERICQPFRICCSHLLVQSCLACATGAGIPNPLRVPCSLPRTVLEKKEGRSRLAAAWKGWGPSDCISQGQGPCAFPQAVCPGPLAGLTEPL